MNKSLSCIFAILIAAAFSCSKKNTPTPDPPKPPTDKLSITDFNPKSAMIGATVMITGKAFGTDSNQVSIKFGNATGVKPKTITDTKMTVLVPAGASTGKIQITINGTAVSSTEDFTLTDTPPPLPTITEFSPSSAQAGETVTIKGTGFLTTDTSFVSISFGNAKAVNPFILTPNTLVVKVPEDAQTGKIKVVMNGGTPLITSQTFTFKPTPLTIGSFTPKTAKAGDTVSITGTGFGADIKLINVTFGSSKAAKPFSGTGTKLQVAVPADAATGKICITVNGGTLVSSTDNFTLKLLSITSFTPKSVAEGDTVKITGMFGPKPSDVKVYFVDTSLPEIKPFKASATELFIKVPIGATTTKIRLDVNSEYVESKENLVVVPRIGVYFFEPTSARAGQTVRINNSLNVTDVSTISIKFGSSAAVHPILSEAKFLTVRIPNDAKSDYISISKEGYATGKSSSKFTVLPDMPPIQQGAWTKRADIGMGNGKAGAIAFTIGGKAYVGCGTTNAPFDGFGSNDMWEYDPQYNAWTQKASFSGGKRVNAVAFAIGNKGYVGTGLTGDSKPTKDFWEYDPQTNKWSQKADFTGSTRAFAVGFSTSTKGYIGSGNNGSTSLDDFYEYSPSSNSWDKVKSIPGVRAGAFAFVVDSKAYVGNGYYTNAVNTKFKLTDFYQYDTANDTWTSKAAIPSYSYTTNNASFSIGSKGYVGLGYDVDKSPTFYGTVKAYEYSTTANSWKELPNIGAGLDRSSAVGFALDNVGYFGMGQSIGATRAYSDFYAFKP